LGKREKEKKGVSHGKEKRRSGERGDESLKGNRGENRVLTLDKKERGCDMN